MDRGVPIAPMVSAIDVMNSESAFSGNPCHLSNYVVQYVDMLKCGVCNDQICHPILERQCGHRFLSVHEPFHIDAGGVAGVHFPQIERGDVAAYLFTCDWIVPD